MKRNKTISILFPVILSLILSVYTYSIRKPLPDLRIKKLTIRKLHSKFNNKIKVKFIVANTGHSKSPRKAKVALYHMLSGTSQSVVHTWKVPAISPGTYKFYSTTITLHKSGYHVFKAFVDPRGEIREENYLNNSATIAIRLEIGLPDLAVSYHKITRKKLIRQGTKISVEGKFIVENSGTATAKRKILIIATGRSRNSVKTKKWVLPALKPDRSRTIHYNFILPLQFPLKITIIIDPNNTIAERSKSNNRDTVYVRRF